MSLTGAAACQTHPRSGGWWCATAQTQQPWSGSTNGWRPSGWCSAYARSLEPLACLTLFVDGRHDIRQSALQCHPARTGDAIRSEEHTSELQSLMHNSYAVFSLKKKTHE